MKSIKSVLLMLLAVTLGAMLVLSGFAWWNGQRMQAQARKVFVAKDVTADILPPPMYLIEARLLLSEALEGARPADEVSKEFEQRAAEYKARVEYWMANPPFGLEEELLGAQHAAAQRFFDAARAQVLQPIVAGKVEEARAALPSVHKHYVDHRLGVNRTVKVSNAFAEENIAGFDAVHASIARGSVAVPAAALLLVAVLFSLGWRRLQKGIALPLQHACRSAELLATGDLSVQINPHGRDEAGLVLRSLASMQAGLREVVGQVRGGVDCIATASLQIAQGNGDLSARTEHQSANLQQTAGAMHEVNAAARSSAENANEANRLATEASVAAARGGEVVAKVVSTMSDIQGASRRIADIISVVDGIAFQTNILALNAAVEAARSGEHGRGFAVVANEVRNLARRSADEAKQIKSLIDSSVEHVDAGSALVHEAGGVMSEIVEQVGNVSALIGQISVASQQQSQGLGHINDAVAQLDGMTQQNAALVEQSAAAAESMNQQTKTLAKAVSAFRLTAPDALLSA